MPPVNSLDDYSPRAPFLIPIILNNLKLYLRKLATHVNTAKPAFLVQKKLN